jgi:hypothetical protein
MSTWQNQQVERYSISFAFSVVFNLLILLLCGIFMNASSENSNGNSLTEGKKLFTVESFRKLPSKKIRTVGVKGGKKNSFSSPTKMKSGNGGLGKPSKVSKATKEQTQTAQQKVNNQKMQQLGASNTAGLDFKPKKVERAKKKQSSNSGFVYTTKEPLEKRLQKQQKQLQGDVLQQLAANPNAGNAISGKGFNIQFDPPEGITEDELNSVEKIFYSFQKRTFQTYVNSFIKTYYDVLRSNPILKSHLNNERHRLNGRVTFDDNGNILAVKIMRSSQSDEVHKLFETTLDQMRAIPNPPKALVQKDGTFSIYFSLYIN